MFYVKGVSILPSGLFGYGFIFVVNDSLRESTARGPMLRMPSFKMREPVWPPCIVCNWPELALRRVQGYSRAKSRSISLQRYTTRLSASKISGEDVTRYRRTWIPCPASQAGTDCVRRKDSSFFDHNKVLDDDEFALDRQPQRDRMSFHRIAVRAGSTRSLTIMQSS